MAQVPKLTRFTSRRLLDAAKGQLCVLCKVEKKRDTVVPAHLPGAFYGMAAGHGQKTHDWLVAHLCDVCHAAMDNECRRDAQIRMKALCLTLQRLFDQGVLLVLDSPHARTGDDHVGNHQEKNKRGLEPV